MAAETIAIGADHAGFALKSRLARELSDMGYKVMDLGTVSEDSVDYPDFADAVAETVLAGRARSGILICGSGIGMSIAANRHRGIRAALCGDVESATLARRHNDANVLVLGGRRMDAEAAQACLRAFLSTPFDGGRHARRVAKLT